MRALGLDIGTTTLCAMVADISAGTVLKSVTLPNDAAFSTGREFERVQQPQKILEKIQGMADELIHLFAPIDVIGITGQMHGIVYLDCAGNAVSPLYTWQDESGNLAYVNGKSYACVLEELTGIKSASGFGGTTYFYHAKNSAVPRDAAVFCTIHDFVAMKLAGGTSPLVHVSDAASFGLFGLEENAFDLAAAGEAGLDPELFPRVAEEFAIVGEYGGIPVCTAIGDNQASFLGSVKSTRGTLLVNMGTGGQMSLVSELKKAPRGTELRPLNGGERLLVGSSLCGGRAFALLEEFFRSTAELVTGKKTENAYPAIDSFLACADEPQNPLKFSTLFCGTRDMPARRASITNLGLDNFTPQHFIFGVLDGMADEIYSMYVAAGSPAIDALAGSGNALRKNAALRDRFSKVFGHEMVIPPHREEAAFGAAVSAVRALEG